MSVASPEEAGSLTRAAVAGTVWRGSIFFLTKATLLLSTAVLARLLSPADFGLIALVVAMIAYLDVLGDGGVASALIYRRRLRAIDIGTAVTLAALIGLLLVLLAAVSAPLVARVFDEPRAVMVMRVLSIALLLDIFAKMPEALLRRDLNFKRQMLPEASRSVLKGGLSILLAFAGLGVWSLVWGQVAGSAIATIIYWCRCRSRLIFKFDRVVAGELLRFGLPVTLLGLLAAVIQSLDVLVIGQRLGAAALGIYALAFRLPDLLVMNLCYVASQVLFPAYARLQGKPELLRVAFLSTLRYVSLVTLPLGVGLIVVAPDLVSLLFGSRWQAVVPVMRLLAAYVVIRSLSFNVGDLYKGIGRPWVLNRLAVLRLALVAPTLWIASARGLVQVAGGMLGVAAIILIIELVVARNVLGTRWLRVIAAFGPALTSSLLMLICCCAFRTISGTDTQFMRLGGTVIIGIAAYVAVLRWGFPAVWRALIHLAIPTSTRVDRAQEAQAAG